MENRVEIKNLGKAYGRRKLFTGISVTIADRSVFRVLGRNGAGKTTLLSILCGLIPATEGTVEYIIGGKVLDAAEKRREIGLVSPDLQLYDELSAVENLEFFCKVRGLPFTLRRARDLLEFVGLGGRGRDYLRTYSSGLKQRLKFASALLHEPHVLLLDEPANNLDEAGLALVEEIVKRQREKGIVVMATHGPGELSHEDQALFLA